MAQLTNPKVKINYAEVAELKTLTGIGPAISQNIVNYRLTHGNLSRETIENIQHIKVSSGMLEEIDFTPNPLFMVKAAQLKTEKDDPQSEPPTQSDNVKVTDPQTQGIGQADQSDNQANAQLSDQDDGNQASADKSQDQGVGYDYTQQVDDTKTMIDNASKLISKANSVKTASTTQPHYDDYTEYSYTDSDHSTDQKPLVKKHHKKHHSKAGYTSPGKKHGTGYGYAGYGGDSDDQGQGYSGSSQGHQDGGNGMQQMQQMMQQMMQMMQMQMQNMMPGMMQGYNMQPCMVPGMYNMQPPTMSAMQPGMSTNQYGNQYGGQSGIQKHQGAGTQGNPQKNKIPSSQGAQHDQGTQDKGAKPKTYWNKNKTGQQGHTQGGFAGPNQDDTQGTYTNTQGGSKGPTTQKQGGIKPDPNQGASQGATKGDQNKGTVKGGTNNQTTGPQGENQGSTQTHNKGQGSQGQSQGQSKNPGNLKIPTTPGGNAGPTKGNEGQGPTQGGAQGGNQGPTQGGAPGGNGGQNQGGAPGGNPCNNQDDVQGQNQGGQGGQGQGMNQGQGQGAPGGIQGGPGGLAPGWISGGPQFGQFFNQQGGYGQGQNQGFGQFPGGIQGAHGGFINQMGGYGPGFQGYQGQFQNQGGFAQQGHFGGQQGQFQRQHGGYGDHQGHYQQHGQFEGNRFEGPDDHFDNFNNGPQGGQRFPNRGGPNRQDDRFEGPRNYQGQRRGGQRFDDRPEMVPKGLRYDGTDDWRAFQQKFTSYAQARGWPRYQCRDYLCWCLEGKASEYFATLMEREPGLPYVHVMEKMKKRFGLKEIPETAQVKLSRLRQDQGESVEDWADRVMQLANRAFPNLPDDHVTTQIINRICHGCSDKEAGHHVVNLHLDTVEEVLDQIKSFQYNRDAIYDRGHKSKEVRMVYASSDSDSDIDSYEEPVQVRQTRSYDRGRSQGKYTKYDNKQQGSQKKGQGPGLHNRLSSLEEELGGMKSNMETLLKQVGSLVNNNKRSYSPIPRTRSRSPTPSDICFHCGRSGHFKAECPKLKQANKPPKAVTFQEQSNDKGSRSEA